MLDTAPAHGAGLMDFVSNGRFPLDQWLRLAALLTLSAGLAACAPKPARSDATQEIQMNGPMADVRAEQDRVAALVDEIAQQTSAHSEPTHGSEPAPLPSGPALSAQALEAGIVRLINALVGEEQTTPQAVSTLLDVALAPDGRGRITGATGALGEGTYEIAVWPASAGNPGHQVSIRVHPKTTNCALTVSRLTEVLDAAGYTGKPLPRPLGPSLSFSKVVGANKLFVFLDTDAHAAPRCVHHVSVELERVGG